MVDVAYVGDHGDHLQSFMHDPNQGLPANMALGSCLYQNISAQGTGTACAGQALVAVAPILDLTARFHRR